MRVCYFVCLFLCVSSAVDAAKILGVFQTPSISHQLVYQPIWKELSLRGHDVTVLTTNPLKDPSLKNLKEIDMSFSYTFLEELRARISKVRREMGLLKEFLSLLFAIQYITEDQMSKPEVLEVLNDENANYDLLILECFPPMVYVFAARFPNTPFVCVFSGAGMTAVHDSIGNPTHPLIVPEHTLSVGYETFYERFISVYANVLYRLLYYFYVMPQADSAARKYVKGDFSYLGDVERNASLVLLNTNLVLHPIRPNLPTVIEMGLMHIKPKQPLPEDLQEVLDKATQGVVYFSLGTNIKSSTLSEPVLDVIIAALSELPYLVLWKWETDHLPNQPSNVVTRKWLPQQDVLGHKNIKVFVMQGGLQSLEESVFNRVPMVAIPFFADQPRNAKKINDLGIGLLLDYMTMTKDTLKEAILEVAQNKTYRKRVGELSDLLADKPMSSLDTAMWWIEYVIRHKGARHLRSTIMDIPLYQYFFLDIISVVLVSSALVVFVLYKSIRFICRLRKSNKVKKA